MNELVMTGPKLINANLIASWRNDARDTLRTALFTDVDSQEKFMANLNPMINRYFCFYDGDTFVAFGGLTYIQWENRIAEISLIVDPDQRRDGIGSECVDMLLNEAFNRINLKTIFGECYKCNPNIKFWFRLTEKYEGKSAILPNRKYLNGEYHDSFYFSIDSEIYRAIQRAGQQVQ
jgi:RimJ/RimL family protein N-acetyltransferase